MPEKRLKILCIDDDNYCLEVAGRFFSMVGNCAVYTATDGMEGLEKARRIIPDVILLDMKMPDMDGSEVMQLLAAEPGTAEIPVVIFTGAVLTDHQNAELKALPNFLFLECKPAKFEELLKRIRTELAERKARLEAGGDRDDRPEGGYDDAGAYS